jgi:oligoribonuclease
VSDWGFAKGAKQDPLLIMKSLFWIDLEMTGLDEKRHHIVEVAAVVTDTNLERLAEYTSVVFQPPENLATMDAWPLEAHTKSGLLLRIPNGKPLSQVETELLELIDRHFSKDKRIVLAGNTVGMDKRFIEASMPRLAARLHYRIIDVSSFKEVFREKYGIDYEKEGTHRALDDIYESIAELKTYLSHVQFH